jgi:hypothetical protein
MSQEYSADEERYVLWFDIDNFTNLLYLIE